MAVGRPAPARRGRALMCASTVPGLPLPMLRRCC